MASSSGTTGSFDQEAQLKWAIKHENIKAVLAYATTQDGSPVLYSQGMTAMHIAVQEKKLEVVRNLPACLVNVAMSTTKETPLHLAARKGLHQIVALLLERGARKNSKSITGQTPFDVALESKKNNVFGILRHPLGSNGSTYQATPNHSPAVALTQPAQQTEITQGIASITLQSQKPQETPAIASINTPITPITSITPIPTTATPPAVTAAATTNQISQGGFSALIPNFFMPPQFQMFPPAGTPTFPSTIALPFPPPFFPGINPLFPVGGSGKSDFKPGASIAANNVNSTPNFPTFTPPVGNFTFAPLTTTTTNTTTTTTNNNNNTLNFGNSINKSFNKNATKPHSSGPWVSTPVKEFSGVLYGVNGDPDFAKYFVSVYESASSSFKDAIRHLLRTPTVVFHSEGSSPQGLGVLLFGAQGDDQSNPVRARDNVYVYIFDLLSPSANEMAPYLQPILGLYKIVKVWHDLSNDSHQLFLGLEIPLKGVFDTQIAYECLTGDMFSGLNLVIEKFRGKSRSTKNSVRNVTDDDTRNVIWTKRPIKQQLLDQAANEIVSFLACVPPLKDALEEKSPGAYDTVLRASQNRADRCAVSDPNLAKKRPIGFVGEPPKMCSRELLLDNIDQSGASRSRQLLVDQAMENILELIPEQFRTKLGNGMQIYSLRDIILDVDRPPYAYFSGKGGKSERVNLNDDPREIYTREMLNRAMGLLEGRFGPDNRAGMDGSLHRISCMRNNRGEVYALTIRIGRSVPGNSDMIRDLLLDPSRSVLLLGVPGSGKTTIVRDAARLIAEEQLNVVVVDTSNEICGDGDVPHWSVGMARRMMVPNVESQARVMIECVQNHTPDVIVIDEIGRPNEVAAAKTVKQRGVRLVASAHGSFRQLVKNPQLNGLVGGVTTVLVGDKTAKEMHDGHKQVAERCGEPIFDTVVELRQNAFHIWRVIDQSGAAVDEILSGRPFSAHYRQRQPEGDHVTIRWAKSELRMMSCPGPLREGKYTGISFGFLEWFEWIVSRGPGMGF